MCENSVKWPVPVQLLKCHCCHDQLAFVSAWWVMAKCL